MISKIYQIADKTIQISSLFDDVHKLCHDYLSNGEPDFSVSSSEKDIDFEREKSAQEDARQGRKVINFSDSYLETLVVYRKIAEQMIDYNTLLFHGSAVAVDGRAYLFCAKSGTGKSTHTRLWREYFKDKAVMVNDDKPLLRIDGGCVQVCGTPWNGKHRLGNNISVELGAVCFLDRAQENHIEPVPSYSALPLLLRHCYKSTDKSKLVHTLDLLSEIKNRVDLYSLHCNMSTDAVITAYNAMKGNFYEAL